jgi:hypothetical protein
MTQRRSKKTDAADVLPPEDEASPSAAAKSAGSKKASEDSLRMPPLIDHGQASGLARVRRALGGLASLEFGAFSLAGALYKVTAIARQMGTRLFISLRRWLYRLALLGLIGATLSLAGFALFQARDLSWPSIGLPELTAFWQGAPSSRVQEDKGDVFAAAEAVPPEAGPALKNQPPVRLSQSDDLAEPDGLISLQNIATQTTALEEERAAHAATRLALAQAQQQIATPGPPAPPASSAQDAPSLAALQQRAHMAELLVRLQNGWAFAQLLENQTLLALQPGLSARQISALALHAKSGVPTQANLAGQAKGLWQAQVQVLEPPMRAPPEPRVSPSQSQAGKPMPAFLQWLSARAGGLVAVQAAPPSVPSFEVSPEASTKGATPSEDLRQIHQFILVGDYDAASTKTRTAILRLDALAAPSKSAAQIESLQALYADLRALQEVTPILQALRQTFLASRTPPIDAGGASGGAL